MKGSIAQDTLPSLFPVQWHWELGVWEQNKRSWELRSLSCLFLMASPARPKAGASFVPAHRQEGLLAARLTNGAVLVPPAVPQLVDVYPQLFWGMDWVIPPASQRDMGVLLLQPGVLVSHHSP